MMPETLAETKTVAWSELGARYEYCVHLRRIVCNKQFLKKYRLQNRSWVHSCGFHSNHIKLFFFNCKRSVRARNVGRLQSVGTHFNLFCGFPQRHNCAFVIKSEYVSQVLLAMQYIHRFAYVSVRRLRRYFRV